jgi:opacity protein-like surface antigen
LLHKRWLSTPLLLVLLAGNTSGAENDQALFQAFIGSLQLNDQTVHWEAVGAEAVDLEFPSSLPSVGLEAEYTYGGELSTWGINTGGSIAFKSSNTVISGGFNGASGGTIRVHIDNSFMLGELHFGGFLRHQLTDRVSAYIGAGPMLLYGEHEVKDDDVESGESAGNNSIALSNANESAFAVGAYARTGLDFSIGPGQFVGLGLRYIDASLDFDDTMGEVDITGPTIALTFAARL